MLDLKMSTFLIVAKIKSFTKAAEILNLTQPAVSQHIKYLEEYYGVKLIKKKGRTIDLTEEGEVLFTYSKELEIIHRRLESTLKNSSLLHRIYRVGATMTIGGYVLPSILGEYKKIYKNIDILLQVNNTEDIIEKLVSGKIDLALVEGPFDKEKFKYKKFKQDELVLAVFPSHDFVKKGEVTFQEVLDGNLILREKGSGTRKIFENKLIERGYEVGDRKPYMEIGSIPAIKSLVESDLGYTIISRETIKREVAMGLIQVVPIRNEKIYREFNFVYLEEGTNEFIEHFINYCELAL